MFRSDHVDMGRDSLWLTRAEVARHKGPAGDRPSHPICSPVPVGPLSLETPLGQSVPHKPIVLYDLIEMRKTRYAVKRMTRLFVIMPFIPAEFLSACSTSPAVQEITVDAKAMQYQPASFGVTAGRPIRLTFKNDSGAHDFNILETPTSQKSASSESMADHDTSDLTVQPELHAATPPGGSSLIEFTPSKPGAYEFSARRPSGNELPSCRRAISTKASLSSASQVNSMSGWCRRTVCEPSRPCRS